MSSIPADGVQLEVLKFGAPWCGVCHLVDPVLDRVVKGFPSVTLRRIDVEQDRTTADQFEVKSLPTLILRSADGHVLGRMSGTMSGKEITAALEGALQKAATAA